MTCDDIERDLDLYVDRELGADSDAVLRQHLRGCVACRRRIADREAIGPLVRSMPYYPAPDRLRMQVLTQARRARSRRLALAWAAAAVLVVSLSSGIALVRSSRTAGESVDAVVDAVVDGHVRSLMADHLVDVASTDQHTVKPWFLGKLDFSPPVRDLASLGFPLVGGRLEYLSGRPAAALVYQRQKHTINVFIRPGGVDTSAAAPPRFIRGFHVHEWTRDGMTFWVVSDVNDAELAQFVRALQES